MGKITTELNPYDNVILEICDEPGIHGTPPEEYTPWLEALAQAIAEAENSLPNRHLIAQQICGILGGAGDLSEDPRVTLVVSQYIGGTAGAQFGGMQLLDAGYGHNKPLELNETAYYPIWYEGDRIGAARVEAWEFIIGGGAGFNHLNGLFSTINPAAKDCGNEPVLQALQNLNTFIHRFDFIRMNRYPPFVIGTPPEGAFVRGIHEHGRQYALYIHHSKNMNVKYVVQPGEYQDTLLLNLPAGSYQADWIDPATGGVIWKRSLHSPGGSQTFTTPRFSIDIALGIKAYRIM